MVEFEKVKNGKTIRLTARGLHTINQNECAQFCRIFDNLCISSKDTSNRQMKNFIFPNHWNEIFGKEN